MKVVSIGKKAFQNTNLSSVEIGKNIKMIYKDAFRGCGQLKNFTIYTKNLQFVGKNSLKGTTSNLRIKVPKKKLEEYQKLFRYLPGLKKNVVFQSSYLW